MKKNDHFFNYLRGGVLAFLWAISLSIFAQSITVSGKVSDANQEPLTGVAVQIKGSGSGTVTDLDGN